MFRYPSSNKSKNTDEATDTGFEDISPEADWSSTDSMNSFGGGIPVESDDMDNTSNIAPSAPIGTMNARNVLNSDVSVVGVLRFSNELLVDGNVDGEITSDGILTVGANATIISQKKDKPAIHTKSAIIHGKVSGNVLVDDLVELAKNAELVGDITAARLIVHDGAVFIGRCAVGAASSEFESLTKKSAAPAQKAAKSTPITPVPQEVKAEPSSPVVELGDLLA